MPRVPPVTTATRAIWSSPLLFVMAGLVPAIHVLGFHQLKDVDARLKGRSRPSSTGYGRHDDVIGSNSGRSALHAHRDAHAAADAERGEALLGIALLHL